MTMAVSKAERKVSRDIPDRNEQHRTTVLGRFILSWEIIGRVPLGPNTVFWKTN